MVKVDNKYQARLQNGFHRYCKCSELMTLHHVTPSFKGGDAHEGEMRMSNTVGTASQHVVKTNQKKGNSLSLAHRLCFALFNKYNL